MGVTAKQPDQEIKYEPIPMGLHTAICYGVFDLGTQHIVGKTSTGESFDNWLRRVLIVWELPEVRGEFERDGKKMDLPRAISQEYTLSLHSKSGLRHDLETWRSKGFTENELKGFDITKLLGVPCQIQVIHKPSKDGSKTYSNVGSIVQAPKGYEAVLENDPVYFSFEDNMEIPETIPEWIQNKIKQSKEWKDSEDTPDNVTPLDVDLNELNEDVPF